MIDVQWTEVAKDDFVEILKKVYERSADLAVRLNEEMEALQQNLSQFKHFCPPSVKFPKFRRCIVNKDLALVYEAGESSITIISVFDTRAQHPFN